VSVIECSSNREIKKPTQVLVTWVPGPLFYAAQEIIEQLTQGFPRRSFRLLSSRGFSCGGLSFFGWTTTRLSLSLGGRLSSPLCANAPAETTDIIAKASNFRFKLIIYILASSCFVTLSAHGKESQETRRPVGEQYQCQNRGGVNSPFLALKSIISSDPRTLSHQNARYRATSGFNAVR
jgi:hypothetical protein